MYWGVRPILITEQVESPEDVVAVVEQHLVESSLAKSGQILVILMAQPLHQGMLTNLMRIHRVK
jgi:pyruvate kinase